MEGRDCISQQKQTFQPFFGPAAGNLGGGTGVAFEEIDLTSETTTPIIILATLQHNTMV